MLIMIYKLQISLDILSLKSKHYNNIVPVCLWVYFIIYNIYSKLLLFHIITDIKINANICLSFLCCKTEYSRKLSKKYSRNIQTEVTMITDGPL